MSFGAYLFVMFAGTALSWTAWALVLMGVDPDSSGPMGFAMFYLTLTMALIGTLSLLELLFRRTLSRERGLPTTEVRTSFRHAVLLSIVAVASLGMTAQGVFTWWSVLLLLFVASLVEYLSLVVQRTRRG